LSEGGGAVFEGCVDCRGERVLVLERGLGNWFKGQKGRRTICIANYIAAGFDALFKQNFVSFFYFRV
jgi:hypothetical protein